MVKNILKWQGGKSSLMPDIIGPRLPRELMDPGADITFIDVFAGGGSVFLWVLQNCPGVRRILVNDMNYKVIQLYWVIQNRPAELKVELDRISGEYQGAPDKEKYYYQVRTSYNTIAKSEVVSAAELMFLNRACFNGVYRENPLGIYNVPWGKRESITLYRDQELEETAKLLNKPGVEVKFFHGDFSQVITAVTPGNTFLYFDPPYRPLTGTKSFTDYTGSPFNDDSQRRLKRFCDRLGPGVRWMVSNSWDPADDFIPKLWKQYHVSQITASRSSGGKGATRGKITENLITNYDYNNSKNN